MSLLSLHNNCIWILIEFSNGFIAVHQRINRRMQDIRPAMVKRIIIQHNTEHQPIIMLHQLIIPKPGHTTIDRTVDMVSFHFLNFLVLAKILN